MSYSKWINDAYAYWDAMSKTEEASLAGVTELSAYIFSSTSENIVKVSSMCSIVPRSHPPTIINA